VAEAQHALNQEVHSIVRIWGDQDPRYNGGMAIRTPNWAKLNKRLIAPLFFMVCVLVLGFQIGAFEDSILYHPDRSDPLKQISMTPKALGFEEVYFETSDGERLNAWYFPPKAACKGTILHFHGNAANLANRLPTYRALAAQGYGVLGVEPRGYGKSTGMPSESGFYEDIRSASRYLTQQKNTPVPKQIAAGESLGGAVVINAAVNIPFRAVVVNSTFTSAKDMAKVLTKTGQLGFFSSLPMEYILRQSYDSLSKIDKLQSPFLIIHGTGDTLVPYRMSQALFERAKVKNKQHVTVQGADHNDVFPMGEAVIMTTLASMLNPATCPDRL